MIPTVEAFLTQMALKSYKVFSDAVRPFNLNIVGWRYREALPDSFGDLLGVYWKRKSGQWEAELWPATTRPGVHYLLRPLNVRGTAILVPGQYTKAYEIGEYRGYEALRQVRPVRVFRDKNRDSQFDSKRVTLDKNTIESGLFGLHIHRASGDAPHVGPWSAGCQVFKRKSHFEHFMELCSHAALMWGNSFTYTLLEI